MIDLYLKFKLIELIIGYAIAAIVVVGIITLVIIKSIKDYFRKRKIAKELKDIMEFKKGSGLNGQESN